MKRRPNMQRKPATPQSPLSREQFLAVIAYNAMFQFAFWGKEENPEGVTDRMVEALRFYRATDGEIKQSLAVNLPQIAVNQSEYCEEVTYIVRSIGDEWELQPIPNDADEPKGWYSPLSLRLPDARNDALLHLYWQDGEPNLAERMGVERGLIYSAVSLIPVKGGMSSVQ
jgi:hypothetical protein